MSPYGYDVIVCGKCSLCGGRVVLPRVWMSVVPAQPICEGCGAVEDDTEKLPVIPMKPCDNMKNPWYKVEESRPIWYTTTGAMPHITFLNQ